MSTNKPKLDKKKTFIKLEEMGMGNCTYKRIDKNEKKPISLPTSYPEPETMVISPSGYIPLNPNPLSPEPSGNIFLCKCFRDDQEEQHVNVDNWLFWQDVNHNCWQMHFKDPDEHVQKYLDGTRLGNIAEYKGYPSQKEGNLKDYEAEGKLGHDKSIPPYR